MKINEVLEGFEDNACWEIMSQEHVEEEKY